MLAGIRVVELATYIAAPGACALLADWGAEVIKVESPRGDPHRQYFGFTGDAIAENRVFDLDNRGKRSIALDLAQESERTVLRDLIATADVLVTNTRPAALARMGLDWDALRAIRRDLIFVQFTGYGMAGPEADTPGFDITAFWAWSGLASLATVKGGEPPMLRTGIGDHTAALALTSGIMAALFHRERTGEGQRIDGSLLRTGIYVGGSEHAIQLQLGRLASPKPREQAVNPISNFFRSADGKWFVLVPRSGADGDWPAVARAAGRADLLDDPRFAGVKARRTNAAALVAALDAAFGAMDWPAVEAALRAEDLIFAPVQSIGDVTRDPQAIAAGGYVRFDGEETTIPAGPLNFEVPLPAPRRAPALDADGPAIRATLPRRG
jgi:crotonobetainyl-CoA:carnitine CoA-transferase CaiB-like acyl-CoA transferase